VHGGRAITNKQPSAPPSESTKTSHTHDPNDEQGAKHEGSPTDRTQSMVTTNQATQKNESSEATNAEELAQTQADIKARMSPYYRQANDMSDMGQMSIFPPDN
jgi:hypothetical protein